jgi:hypothetical protein
MTIIELNNDDVFMKDPNTNLYTCTTCSYYTPLRNSFIKHLKTDKHKINENPLECEHCNKLFHTKISYNNHIKCCIIQDSDKEEEENISEDPDEDTMNDDEHGLKEDEDLGLLLSKFGNEYDKLMIKYILLFFLKIKENMLPVNLLLIFVFFMWTR